MILRNVLWKFDYQCSMAIHIKITTNPPIGNLIDNRCERLYNFNFNNDRKKAWQQKSPI